MEEDQYKSVLIVNDTNDDQIRLYIYPWWDVICWVSSMSKIIMPNRKYLHRCKKDFQFKLVAIYKDTIGKRRKRTLRETAEWQRDVLFKITNSTADSSSPYNVDEGDLANYPQEKRICLRMLQRDKELKSTAGVRNYYEVLGLDMDDVRKMPKDEQDEILRKAWKRECLRWHPDKNGGDDEVYLEIDAAYTMLKDHADRAHYNNMVDYDSGWLSWKRYRALFNPTCVTDEQREARDKRLLAMALSVVLVLLGGIALGACTAGLALPAAALACGAVFEGGLTGAGMRSLQYTLKRSTVDKGVNAKDWLLEASIGFLSGAVPEGAGVGIPAPVTGIGAAAFESASVKRGQHIGIRIAKGIGGMASSLASAAGRKFVDGEDMAGVAFTHGGTSAATQEEPDNNEPDNSGRVKYISEGFWSSKMVVSYTLSGNEVTQEVQGSGKAINIPAQATSITVKFQVLRPGWWDISKYDRFQKRWCKPYEPHVFHYAKPPIRTFTIYGNLWWEAVMRVSDEYHEETGEM